MKTIIRNFTSIFRKFVTANLLNLLGLSLAFASFFVIMTQVIYDLGYNKSFAEHEKLFRLTMEFRHTSPAMASSRDGSTTTNSWWTTRSTR